jgi:hypothetical protein
MWNGNQYTPQISTRLDFTNQIQQRPPPRQSSPSSQYSQSINNSTVTTNDRWINLPWTDPAIISFGNKLDTAPSQWSTTTQSQGSSTLSSGNNLMPTSRWSQQQQQQQSTQSQAHMLPNGIYSPYSTTSGVDDGNRS